jgi:hypothetical protein
VKDDALESATDALVVSAASAAGAAHGKKLLNDSEDALLSIASNSKATATAAPFVHGSRRRFAFGERAPIFAGPTLFHRPHCGGRFAECFTPSL